MRNILTTAAALALGTAVSAQTMTTDHLAALDTNGDGYISAAESAGFMSPDQFAAANTNGDDGISAAEFTAATQADFAAADRDGDGVLN
jgi:hypothetical protein